MQQQRALRATGFAKRQQQVFAAPLDLLDALPAQQLRQVGGNRPAQHGMPHHDAADAAALQMRLDTAAGGFDFGQFRHTRNGLVGWVLKRLYAILVRIHAHATGCRKTAAYTSAMVTPAAPAITTSQSTAKSSATSSADEGVDRKRLRVIKQRFMAINQQRLQRTRTGLDSRQLTFLDLLPILFHSNHPMLPGYVSHLTPHGLSDYNPSKSDITRAKRVARSFTYVREPHMPRRVHGLFLMGSCGTIAQSEGSDFDIWVCHAAEISSEEERLLRRKCDEISQWAASLRLEVHFFLMEGEKFRLGERAGVSTEDCGSSQHF